MNDANQLARRVADLERMVNELLAPKSKPRLIVNSGGSDAILFKTRTGGIAARTTTTLPHTFPSATVDLIDPDTGDVYSPNREETVYNMTNIAIAHVANRPRQGKKIGSRYFVDVDDC